MSQKDSKPKNEDDPQAMFRCLTEIVNEIIKLYEKNDKINVHKVLWLKNPLIEIDQK